MWSEPYSAGIGGDMFSIVYLACEHKLLGINARGYGWHHLLQRAGTLTFAEVLQPTGTSRRKASRSANGLRETGTARSVPGRCRTTIRLESVMPILARYT